MPIKALKKVLPWLGIALLAALLWVWSQNPFGTSLADLEADARQSQQVPEGWASASGTGDHLAAMLFYPEYLLCVCEKFRPFLRLLLPGRRFHGNH